MNQFTPLESSVGALLIQLATTTYLREFGRTIGFSSVISQSVFQPSLAPLSIVLGLALATICTATFLPVLLPPPTAFSGAWLATAGLLVGFGTKWGSGCTSGHMLCGVSLLRVRSIVATIVFSTTAMFVVNYFELVPSRPLGTRAADPVSVVSSRTLLLIIVSGYLISRVRIGKDNILKALSGIKAGFLFGMGLFISGMANPAKPQGFLALLHPKAWDPSLLMIVLFAIGPNILQWRSLLRTQSRPELNAAFELPTATAIPAKFLIGNAVFGIGWGMAGVCPGPGLVGSLVSAKAGIWLGTFLLGQYIGGLTI